LHEKNNEVVGDQSVCHLVHYFYFFFVNGQSFLTPAGTGIPTENESPNKRLVEICNNDNQKK